MSKIEVVKVIAPVHNLTQNIQNNNLKDRRNQKIRVLNYKMPNGSIYNGQLLHGKSDGMGQLIYINKQKYIGYFVKGMKNGQGKYYYQNGDYYIGDWVNNKKQGRGTYFYNNKSRYEGQFKNNMKHGKGKIIQDNGNYYQGEFFENHKDKEGFYHNIQQNRVYKFIFDKGVQKCSAQVVKIQNPTLNSQQQIKNLILGQGEIPQFLVADPQRVIQQIVSVYLDPKLKTEKSLFASSFDKYDSEYKQLDSVFVNPFSKNYIHSEQLPFEKMCIKNQYLRQKKIVEWDINDVCQWLQQILFSDFQDQFRFQKITGFSLLLLQEEDLKQLTVASESDRRILLKQIKFLQIFFKIQCKKDSISKMQNLDLTVDLVKKFSQQKQQLIEKDQNIMIQKIQQKVATSIENNQQNDDKSSSSSQSSSQQGKQVIVIEQNTKKQNQVTYKWERKKKTKKTMQRKIQQLMRKKGIDYKIVIPRQQVQINKKIGKGGYGQVYLASWMGQNVAVKRYTKKKGFRNRHIGHFLQQAEIINKLSHPNIVLFMGMFVYNNQYAIIMQYLSGGSLFDYLHKKGYKPSISRVFNICKDIALGMSYLHGKNILHCDLKSSNVLIDQNWTVKISDFGLSQRKTLKKGKAFKGVKLGTPQWMAPQIMRGEKYQPASDVYSFGVIIWQLLTCQIPYRNMTQKQILQKVAKQNVINIPQQNKQNEFFIDIFKKSTTRQISERITFEQIVNILQQNQHKFITPKITKSKSKGSRQRQQLNNNLD